MDPEKFLSLGEELVARKTPCDCRAAIGRAYYGVLQSTAKFMRESGVTPPHRQEIHQKIWHDLLNCGISELSVAGSELGSMHGRRIQADHDMDNPDPEQYQTAHYWVTAARQHYNEIRAAFLGPNRQQVVDGIRAYRRKVNRPL